MSRNFIKLNSVIYAEAREIIGDIYRQFRGEGRSISSDAIRIYGYQILALGFGWVANIIIARILGPAEKGVFDLFNLLNSFIIEFGLLGFGSGLLYYLANKGRPLSEVNGTGFLFSLVMGLLTAMISLPGLSLWRRIFPGLHDWIILLAFFLAPVAYYRLIWSNIMTGINQAVATYRIGFYFVVGNFSAILALWAFDWLGAENVIGLTAVLGVINGVVAFIVIHKCEPTLKPSIPLAWESLRYGLAIYVGFIANVVHFKIDQVMINHWMGTEAVGIYAVSVGWAEKLFLLDNAIVSAALYRISSSSARESYALTKRLLKVQLLISGSSGLLLTVLAYPLILTLYGKAYGGAVWPLIVLVPSVVAWSLTKVMSQYISYQRGKKWIPTIFAMSGMLINIFLNLVLIRAYDTTGAALARAISCAFVMALTFVGLRRLGTRD